MPPFLFAILLATLQALAAPIPLLAVEGSIDPGSADYLVAGIAQAEADGAQAVIITLDTPGGLLSSTREIVQAELGAQIPVIVYVSPSGARAGSAGVFITMAAQVAAMAPGTTIGAAHPVDLFGGFGKGDKGEEEEQGGEVMEEKILNDTLAWARAIAEQRGRDVGFAEEAVRTSEALTDREALERGVVDLVAEDVHDLLRQLDGRQLETSQGLITLRTSSAETALLPMSLRQRVMHQLGDPNVIFLLLALGLLGLYVEYHNPGLVVPGVLGVCFLVAVGVALSVLPFNVAGLLLVVLGFGLFALEIWIPSYGALTAGGVLSLLLGGILLFEVEDFDLRVEFSTLIPVTVLAGLLALLVGWLVVRSHKSGVRTGREGLAGAEGEVTEGGLDRGWVEVEGVIWKAHWSGRLQQGQRIRVIETQRLVLKVEPRGTDGLSIKTDKEPS